RRRADRAGDDRRRGDLAHAGRAHRRRPRRRRVPRAPRGAAPVRVAAPRRGEPDADARADDAVHDAGLVDPLAAAGAGTMRRAFLAWLLLAAAARAQQAVKIDVVMRGGRRASGPEVVRLKKGDAVELTVAVDAADELHLHGYDLSLKLQAGKPGTLKFVADRT